MIFAGRSRIGTLGSCVGAVVVVMLCEMKGMVVCVFSVLLFFGYRARICFRSGLSHSFF